MKPDQAKLKFSKARQPLRKAAAGNQLAHAMPFARLPADGSVAGQTGRCPVRRDSRCEIEADKAVIEEIETKLKAWLSSESSKPMPLVEIPATAYMRLNSQLLFRFCSVSST